MPRMQRPYQKTVTVQLNGSGAGSYSFDHNSMGFPPYLIGSFNIVATGMGSGTFSVKGVFADDVARPLDASTYANAAVAKFTDQYILDGIVVEVTGGAHGGTAKVTLIALGRDYRFELGV